MIIGIVIMFVIAIYAIIVLLLTMPGCTGNCQQGKYECDCPLKKDQYDI